MSRMREAFLGRSGAGRDRGGNGRDGRKGKWDAERRNAYGWGFAGVTGRLTGIGPRNDRDRRRIDGCQEST